MQARFEEGREEGIEFVALNMIRSGTEQIRDYIALNNTIACIPDKVNAKIKHGFDADLYRKRNIVERFFQRIKNYRNIAIRYDKLVDCFLNFVLPAAAVITFNLLTVLSSICCKTYSLHCLKYFSCIVDKY